MAFADLADPRIEPVVKILAYELYDSHGDHWPVFWSTLTGAQKINLFNIAYKVMKAAGAINVD